MTKGPSLKRTLNAFSVCALVAMPLLGLQSATAAVPSHERIRVLESARPIGEARLTDQNGHAVALSSIRGSVTFVLFGYTNCPDACPAGMERLLKAIDAARQLEENVFRDWPSFTEPSLPADSLSVDESLGEALGITALEARQKIDARRRKLNAKPG